MSENPSVSEEALRQARLYADAYQLGISRRTAANQRHEDRVRTHWEAALTEFFRRAAAVPREEQHAAGITFLAAHFEWPLTEAIQKVSDISGEAQKPRRPALWRWLLAALLLAAPFVLPGRPPMLLFRLRLTSLIRWWPNEALPVWLAIVPLLLLVFARPLRLWLISWKKPLYTQPETYCDALSVGPVRNLCKRALAVWLAALVGVAAWQNLPSPVPGLAQQVRDTARGYNHTVPVKALDELLLQDGALSDEGIAALRTALDTFSPGTEHALQLAAYMCLRADAGFPEEEGRTTLRQQLDAIDFTEFYSSSNLALLADIRRLLPEIDVPSK